MPTTKWRAGAARLASIPTLGGNPLLLLDIPQLIVLKLVPILQCIDGRMRFVKLVVEGLIPMLH